jgi:hypothetical protein
MSRTAESEEMHLPQWKGKDLFIPLITCRIDVSVVEEHFQHFAYHLSS